MTLTDALNRATGRPRSSASQLAEETQRVGNLLAKAHDAGEHDDPGAKAALIRALEREHDELVSAWHREAAAEGLGSGLTLAKGEHLRDRVHAEAGEPSLGAIVKGLGMGEWGGISADVKAQILSGGASAAIPGAATAGIVDAARERSIIFQCGAQLLPLDQPGAKVARVTSEPSVQWEPEAADRNLADDGWTFDSAELESSSCWMYTTVSIEASEDCVDLDEAISRSFAAQLSLAVDQAAFVGDGADMPLGLLTMDSATDRILEKLDVGDITGYRPFVEAIGAVRAKHHAPTSVVLTPGMWTEMNCLTDKNGNPLQQPRAYTDVAEYTTSLLPENGGIGQNQHTVVIGDLSQVVVGMRTPLTIEVSRTGDGFKRGLLELRGYLRFGSYVLDPTAVLVMRGLTIPDAGS